MMSSESVPKEGQKKEEQKKEEERKEERCQVPLIVGMSEHATRMRTFAQLVAPTRYPVLLTGETGTGKDQLARAIHDFSELPGLFVSVNCAAIPEALFESELFGHSRGAFTGAFINKRGLFDDAKNGTIFLNEIAEIPPVTQAKLLGALEGSYRCVGGSNEKEKRVNARVIAATNLDIKQALTQGKLRHDLYYRLNMFELVLSPLRERREDIPALARHFLRRERMEKKEVTPEAMEVMMRYDWPGNVRELKSVVVSAAVQSNGNGMIGPEYLKPHLACNVADEQEAAQPLPAAVAAEGAFDQPRQWGVDWRTMEKMPPRSEFLAEAEREYLREALIRNGGNSRAITEVAGLSYKSVLDKIARFGLRDLTRSLRGF